MLELVGSGEGNDNVCNRGTTSGEDGRTEIVPVNQTADFSQVAVGKVGRRQSPTKDDRDVMFAVGRHRLYYKER